jgi:hypothetical protein
MLSARDVETALPERILRAAYPRGGTLPSVRALAAELGASPQHGRSSGAGTGQAGLGVGHRTPRRGGAASAARRLQRAGDMQDGLRRLAIGWHLGGQDRSSFEALVARVADEVFQPAPRIVFLECNRADLDRGLEQVQRETTVKVEPLLLQATRADPARLADAAVLLTPDFHVAEARELAPAGAQVVPLNFVPLRGDHAGAGRPARRGAVGVVAVDDRSRRRLEAIVQQYSPAAVRGVLLRDRRGVARLVDAAHLVMATDASWLPEGLAGRARRLLRVGWTLEGNPW